MVNSIIPTITGNNMGGNGYETFCRTIPTHPKKPIVIPEPPPKAGPAYHHYTALTTKPHKIISTNKGLTPSNRSICGANIHHHKPLNTICVNEKCNSTGRYISQNPISK